MAIFLGIRNRAQEADSATICFVPILLGVMFATRRMHLAATASSFSPRFDWYVFFG